MARVVFYGAISLDGYLADQDHSLEWLTTNPGDNSDDYERFYQSLDYTMMGRKTYQGAQAEMGTVNFYPDTENFVFSHQPLDLIDGFELISGDPVRFVQNLPADKTIWVVGGAGLVKELLAAELIDEWWIQIVPILLGSGIPLFLTQERKQQFTLVETRQFGQFAELHLKKKSE